MRAPAGGRGPSRRPAYCRRPALTEGVADLTFERVARAAGVSKTTLYKWWPSKGALALDGYFHAVEEALTVPDTGDIHADLLTQLRAFAHVMTYPPRRTRTDRADRRVTDR
ncbi:TetR/AcrR family transcriptional regulator [Streptomyces sp. NPDC003737]|uniref:HTH tetR-type domain-containing protein n=1 Tax=Streptomyces lannensis TaxID=766498 RepID=A0ABP7LYB1_9ACTN